MTITLPGRAPDYAIRFPADGTYGPSVPLDMGGGVGLQSSASDQGQFTVGTDARGRYVTRAASERMDLFADIDAITPTSVPEIYIRLRSYQAAPLSSVGYATGADAYLWSPDLEHSARIETLARSDAPQFSTLFAYDSDSYQPNNAGLFLERRLAIKPAESIVEWEISDLESGSDVDAGWSWSLGPVGLVTGLIPYELRAYTGTLIYAFDVWNGAGGTGMWGLRQRQSLGGNAGGWPLRQRQNGGHTGAHPLRQRQRGL